MIFNVGTGGGAGGSQETALNTQTLGYVKKNLFKNTATTQTINGVTFTVNNDGSVSASGQASASTYFTVGTFTPKADTQYMFSDGGSSDGSRYAYVTGVDGTTNNYKNGKTFTPATSDEITCVIFIAGGMTANLTFYPMIRLASITDNSYMHYVEDVNTRFGGCSFKYENGKFYIGYDDATQEV